MVNSANLGSVPATRIAADAAGLPRILAIGIATSLTKKFNKRLAKRLDQIQAVQTVNSVQIEEFNLFSNLERVRFVGRLFGLNISDACFNTDLYRDFSMLMAEREFDPDCAPNVPNGKPNFDEFVFFDDLHPSGWVHAAIGKALAITARKLIDD